MKKPPLMLATLFLIFFAIPLMASAFEIQPITEMRLNVPIGDSGSTVKIGPGSNPLGDYIKTWYGFIIGTIGILATVMIMWAGFKWLTSRGNSKTISDAKDIIWSSITGLLIAFLSYTILNLMNPNLTKIGLPALESSLTAGSSTGFVGGGSGRSRSGASGSWDLPDTGTGTSGTDSGTGTEVPPNSMSRSQNYSRLTGNAELVNSGDQLLDYMRQNSFLPEGFVVTSGYREGSTGQHGRGNAFDVAWPDMTTEQADHFIGNVRRYNPEFHIIREITPEEQAANRATGRNIHIDLRNSSSH